MYFLMRCHHHNDIDALRDQHRPAHRAWVKSGGEGLAIVLIGSATHDEHGFATGNFGILKAADLVSAQAFADGDPFAQNGVVRGIELTPLPDSFQADRISNPMTD